jgi:hypothetical protein
MTCRLRWGPSGSGYHDLAGRPSFKLAMQGVDGRFFLYVGAMWEPGLSILDVTDRTRPELLCRLEDPTNTWTIQVQVADEKLIMGREHIPAGWARGSAAAPRATASSSGTSHARTHRFAWGVAQRLDRDAPQLLRRRSYRSRNQRSARLRRSTLRRRGHQRPGGRHRSGQMVVARPAPLGGRGLHPGGPAPADQRQPVPRQGRRAARAVAPRRGLRLGQPCLLNRGREGGW